MSCLHTAQTQLYHLLVSVKVHKHQLASPTAFETLVYPKAPVQTTILFFSLSFFFFSFLALGNAPGKWVKLLTLLKHKNFTIDCLGFPR